MSKNELHAKREREIYSEIPTSNQIFSYRLE